MVLDNARIHRSTKFRTACAGWTDHLVFVLYLPPYSPELNLIELLWRKVKYEWLPLGSYLSFETLCENVRRVLGGYGSEYRINFA